MFEIREYREELTQYVKQNCALFEQLRGKKLLITGAAGLIGSYIIDLIISANDTLDIPIRAIAVDKDRELLVERFPDRYTNVVDCRVMDVNQDPFPQEKADYVIHAASNTSPLDYAKKPVETMQTNIFGTDRAIRHCIQTRAERFLFCSSVEIYGEGNKSGEILTENCSGYVNCNSLRAAYPSAKRAGETLCNAYATQYPSFDFVIARIGRIYGPTVIRNDGKAPTQFIMNGVRHQDVLMKSKGTQEYSFGYVGDCAIALLLILTRGIKGEAYNVADKQSVVLKSFAEAVAEASGTQVRFETSFDLQGSGYSKVTRAVMDTEKIESLGFCARMPLKEGIRRTVSCIRETEERSTW